MSDVRPPIPVADIWEFAPHRPPMVWVDEVLNFSSGGGETRTLLRGQAHYMTTDGYLRPSSCLEFMAQSYGFTSICERERGPNPIRTTPKRAFLAAFNDAQLAPLSVFQSLREGTSVHTLITGARALGPIILFSGLVQNNGQTLAQARMKVFSE